MSFNWPDIPFTGAEVDAFVVEYKALAEAIIQEMDDNKVKTISFDQIGFYLTEPYRNRDFLKELLENGLVYASFIIKQRSGGGGPGTDFVIGNSPYLDSLSANQRSTFFNMLGCIFTKEDMKEGFDRFKEQIGGLPPDPIVDKLINELLSGGNADNPNANPPSFLEQLIDDAFSDLDGDNDYLRDTWDIGRQLQNLWFMFGNKATARIPDFMDRYFTGNGSQLTENFFTPQELADLKSGLKEAFDKGGDIRNPAWRLGSSEPQRIPRTEQFTPTSSQQFAFGMESGDTAHRVRTYDGSLELLLGECIVIRDSQGNIKSVHDDYDFVYGYELDRSNGTIAGEPGGTKVNGTMYRVEGLTHNQVQQQVGSGSVADEAVGENYGSAAGRIGRSFVIGGHERGQGSPFPVKVRF